MPEARSFVDAVRRGDHDAVAAALDRGADPNTTFENEYGHMSVLDLAAGVAHDPELTRLLLDRGADPDDGESVYHSLETEDTACLELLLERGATVRETNGLGHALAMHSVRKVRLLLEQGDLRPTDPELRDALLHTAEPGIVALLIAHGADVNARDRYGRTPYMRAARFRDPTPMRLLEAAGADTELTPATQFLGAVVRGELDEAARVRREHPDLELTPDDVEDLPRWASAGEDEIVARLLDAGVGLDARGVDGGTALHYAGLWGRGSTVALLIARGADIEAASHHGPPLGWTAWGSHELPGAVDRLDGYLAATSALLDAGARVTASMIELAADAVAARLRDAAR